jgi:hypothetical protein
VKHNRPIHIVIHFSSCPPLLLPNLNKIPAINRDILPIQILTACTEQHRSSHIHIPSGPLRRQRPLLILGHFALLILITRLLRRHLTWEDSRSNGVDADLETRTLDLGREDLVEVDDGAFGGVVRGVSLGDAHHAGDGGDVDYCG